MKLTKEQLYADLHAAYMEARRHKRLRDYQQRFEKDMYWQLKYLCDELYERKTALTSTSSAISRKPSSSPTN